MPKKTATIERINELQQQILRLAMHVGNEQLGSPLHQHLVQASQHATLALLAAHHPDAYTGALQLEQFSHLRPQPSPPAAPPHAPIASPLIKKVS